VIRRGKPDDVMSSGPTPEDARKAVDEAVGVFLRTAADLGTLDDVLRETGYIRRSNIDVYPEDCKRLPIPDASPEQQALVVALIDQILDAKRANPAADVDSSEAAINDYVRALYGLQKREVEDVDVAAVPS
jgi:hypothetical protein